MTAFPVPARIRLFSEVSAPSTRSFCVLRGHRRRGCAQHKENRPELVPESLGHGCTSNAPTSHGIKPCPVSARYLVRDWGRKGVAPSPDVVSACAVETLGLHAVEHVDDPRAGGADKWRD